MGYKHVILIAFSAILMAFGTYIIVVAGLTLEHSLSLFVFLFLFGIGILAVPFVVSEIRLDRLQGTVEKLKTDVEALKAAQADPSPAPP